jgi:O-antigen ligase
MTAAAGLASRPGKPGRVEIALAALTLLMFTEAFLPKLLAPPPEVAAADENVFLRYLWLPFYGLVIGGLFMAGRNALSAIVRSPLLMMLCAMSLLSTLWSIAPDVSIRRGVAVTATTLLGVYLAARFDWRDGLRLIGGVWFGLLILTLVSGVIAPKFAVDHETHEGAWTGGWWEKNQMGGHAARAAMMFAFLVWRDAAWRRAWIAALFVSMTLVLLSTSATALLGMMLGFAVLGAAWWMAKGRHAAVVLLWAMVVGLGGLVAIYALAPDMLLKLIGKDATLTGRTDIWEELIRAVNVRPWLGYGYQAFWSKDSEPRYWLQQAVDWAAPSGHNGWLDLAISLGLVGFVLFLLDYLLSTCRAIAQATRTPAAVLALGVLVQLILFSMSESILLWQNSIIWATYCFVSARLALDARRGDGRSSAPVLISGTTVRAGG